MKKHIGTIIFWIVFAWLLFLIHIITVQVVNGQSVDSLWGLRSVRSFTDNHSKWIGGSLVAVALVAQGANNGYFYGGSNRKGIKNLHSIQDVITYSTAGLGYVAGLDAMQASGLNLMVNVAFKGMINVALGQPFINRNEPDTYESFGWERGKLFHGRGRYAQAAVGATMLFYKPIIRKIKKVFR